MVDKSDKKKYNYMENTLTDINREFISLPDEEVKRNNKILESVLTVIINKMKENDALFKAMFQRVFYGGSYYDGLKVGRPEEFDLDLLLSLPKYAEPDLTISNIPGFVHLQLKNYDGFIKQPEAMPTYRLFSNLFDKSYFLDTQKVLQWMEGIVQKTLNDFPQQGPKRILTHQNKEFSVIVHKCGPALTLKISGSGISMDVDLVTCFVFRKEKWPQGNFRANPVQSKPEFFIVPKKPKTGDCAQPSRYWRLSFQEQERVLMDNKRTLKPTIKLLKKLRDNLQHKCIASYYIKTAVLHIAETKDEEFWRNSLSYVFMTILEEYKDYLQSGKIPYYWNKNNNLISGVNATPLQNMTNRLRIIISDIQKKTNEPKTVAQYLLNSEEYSRFSMGKMTLR